MSDNVEQNVPLAIVGMSCRLPGAKNLEEFWQLIVSGGDAAGPLPEDVLERELYFDPRQGVRGKSYSDVGGLVPRLPFDNQKCRLPDEIIANYDPAALAMCEVASEALRDAAYDPFHVPCPTAGVYFGHTGGSPKAGDILYAVYIEQTARYLHRLKSLEALTRAEVEGIARQIADEVQERCDHRAKNPGFDPSPHLGAELVARAYGLDGPCVVVDAACASSLQALSIGARALQLGEIDMAVVGGASYCKSDSLVLFSQAYSVSAGKSCPFDKNATGLVTAEGYIALILKTLDKALADGDRIRCIIRGIGMSADGRGKSLWAPRKEGQIIAMQRAYPHPLKPEDMQYIEAHATSTQVGDATELAALAGAFPGRLASGRKIALGSVKANIGHTLETAGVAGLVKTALAMEHRMIPPVANLTEPNPTVSWEELPFHLPMKAEPWERPSEGTPRRAAVNSFGIGGLNVHIVLEEFLPELAASRGADGGSRGRVATVAKEPIAVIGAGAILPGARTLEAFWELLESGRDPKCEAPSDRWDSALFYDPKGIEPYRCRNKRGGFITDYLYDWRRHKVPPKQVANANPLQFMLLDATEDALRQAGYLERDFDRERVGVIVGSIFGGDFSNQLQAGLRLPEFGRTLRGYLQEKGLSPAQVDEAVKEYEEVLLAEMPALLDETGSFTSSTLASRITKTFDFKGGALAMDAGNSSGLAAIGACINVLRRGMCDMMICATGQRNMDVTAFESMTRFDFLARGESQPAYDERAEGYLPGEGCGALLLKRLSDARRDGDPILAVLHGVAASADWSQPGAALRNALKRALATSGVSPGEIRSVEMLGMLPNLAKNEVAAVAEILGTGDVQRPVMLNSLVSQFGFMGAAHSMAATIKAVLSVSRGRLPAGVVTRRPSNSLPFSPSVQPQQETVALSPETGAAVGVSCGSELGTAYHLIVEPAATAPVERAVDTAGVPAVAGAGAPVRIVRVGGSGWDSLRARLLAGTAEDLYQPDRTFTTADRARVAIVCADAADFMKKCGEAAKRLEDRGRKSRDKLAADGIYFGEPQPFSTGCAFVFPGQGSQYAGMLSQLIDELPEARQACRQVDAAMAVLGFDSFREIAGPEVKDLGTDIWKTQVSTLLSDWIVDETLRRLGIRPSVVAGHSFGEYAAVASAGGWSITDAIRYCWHRYRGIVETPGGDGCMAAAAITREAAERYIAAAGEGVYLANLNAPDQTVIAGTQAAVERCVKLMKKDRNGAVIIKVPCPFHTPMMADAARLCAKRLPEIPLRDGRIPVVSTVNGELITRADEFAHSLVTHLSTPVDYVRMVRTLMDRRVALVIEVGPQQVLTKLNKKNHPADDVVFLASDMPRSPGAARLLGVLAQADCLGCLELDERHRSQERAAAAETPGRILTFDATERRTAKKRQQAMGGAPATRAKAGSDEDRAAVKITPAPVPAGPPVTPTPPAVSRPQAPAPTPAPTPAPAPPEPAQKTAPTGSVDAPTAAELQQILVGFVVEQTGYPEDIIELDADLEADLGIDSIKKAQLIGEVGERFPIAPREDLSFDDFPTLRHVIAFLVEELGSPSKDDAVPAADTPQAAPVSPTPQPQTAVAARPTAAATDTAPATPAAPAASPAAPAVSEDELKEILVGFVVDQTGYPEDIVELDADLEADLGIDSIKKAQLFGEVGERFQIAPPENLSLDDFPTLRHVTAFLVEELGSRTDTAVAPADTTQVQPPPSPGPSPAPPPAEQAPAPAAPAVEPSVATPAPGVDEAELREILVGFVVDQTGYPEDIIEMDADLEADLGIDSIKKAQLFGEVGERFQIAPPENLSLDDFPTLRHVIAFLVEELGSRTDSAAAPADTTQVPPAPPAEQTPAPAAPAPAAPAPEPSIATPVPGVDAAELREILVGFVVDQTGYPEDIIEMDADLEADLGIDSIKKAQLFGELGERFQIAPPEDLSLDDFPTLGHVIAFLVEELGSRTDTAAAPADAPQVQPAPPTEQAPAPVVSAPAPSAAAPAAVRAGEAVDREEVRRQLVDLLVERTGYAAEMISPEAELDAELGMEGVKRERFFAAVSERFGVEVGNDCATVGQLVDRLVERPNESAPDAAALPSEDFVLVQVLEGTAYESGWQHGSALRKAIHRELAVLVDESHGGNGNGATNWPQPWSDEISGLAGGAEVNPGAVAQWNLHAEPLASLRTAFGDSFSEALMPAQRDSITLIQVRRPQQGMAYLTVGKPGRLWAPAAINAAGLVVSAEPLGPNVPSSDMVAVTEQLHHVLATVRSAAAARAQLEAVPVEGKWCFGVSEAGRSTSEFWVAEAGQSRRDESAASPQQQAFHHCLGSSPAALVFTDRRTGAGRNIPLEELLPQVEPEVAEPAAVATPAEEPEKPAATVMRRHVLRMTPAPRLESKAATYCRGDLVGLVGVSDIAPVLRQRLEQAGCRCVDLGEPAAAARAFGSEVPRHLVLLSESAADACPLAEFRPAARFVDTFEICRQWVDSLVKADALDGASLVAVTRMGGDLGFHATKLNYAGGGLTGLFKCVRNEHPGLRVKALDFDRTVRPQEIVSQLIDEVDSGNRNLEVGFRDGRRYLVRAVSEPLPASRDRKLGRGGVWLVTGGGRGVTSLVARQMAVTYGLKLHLLGTAPEPATNAVWRGLDPNQLRQLRRDTALRAREQGKNPAEEWRKIEKAIELDRNLQQFAADGVQATYHQCDIGNRDRLSIVIHRVHSSDGNIDGILHGAGLEAACKFVRKQRDWVEATIAAKCDGAANLIALTADDPLKHFVGFGSTSGRFGGLGQTDYSLASDLLAKMMGRLRIERPECTAVCFHWPAWDGAGMAVRPESKQALQKFGLTFMPPEEGTAHLVAELEAAAGEPEILILDKPEPLDHEGTMTRTTRAVDPHVFRDAGGESDASGAVVTAPLGGQVPDLPDTTASLDPLVESIRPETAEGTFVARVPLNAAADPFLVHHRFRGRPFLPVVVSLDMFAQAVAQLKAPRVFTGFRDIQVLNGWHIDPDRNQEALIRMSDKENGVQCELVGPFYNSQGELVEAERVYVSGVVELGNEPPAVEPIDPGKPVYAWFPFTYPENMDIYHGPPFRTLQKIDFQHGGGRAVIAGRPRNELIGERAGEGMLVSAAALDGSAVACGAFGYAMLERSIAIPLGIRRYRQVRLPRDGESCTLRFFLKEVNQEGSVYDMILLGDAGDVIFAAEGYQTANVKESS